MAKKVPILELSLIHPHQTRKRKFVCSECGMAYNLRDYRTLFDGQKISYFSLKKKPEFRVCHDCIMSLGTRMKTELKVPRLKIKLILEEDEIVLYFGNER